MSTPTDMAAAKSAKMMSIDGDEPPERYMVKHGNFGPIDTSPPAAPIPVINMSLFSSHDSPSSKEEEDELAKLKSALSSWGCMQVIGHGIPEALLDKVQDIAKQFFALPEEEKQKYARVDNETEGYGNDRVVSEEQILDWTDRLSLLVLPKDQRIPKFWPENPIEFGEILNEFSMKVKLVLTHVLKAMAKSLNLEGNIFTNKFGESAIVRARFCFYPSCSKPDQVHGLKPHFDGTGMTAILLDNEVEGLQIFKDNQWFGATSIPYALFINPGDQMEILSNGIFKSPLHRVVTNAKATRISIAIALKPDPEEEIGPLDCLVDENRPRLYQTIKNYAKFNYQILQRGLTPLHMLPESS
ncbi:Non-hem dioxygenase N-terminal domain [Dillenia turbinata]|uniref:Non-hem dioxygenase N-terminal domain n=1 Tax=Dillenia turbinata TaxID=194707 RepID=A0AAN8VXN8_9MAGN